MQRDKTKYGHIRQMEYSISHLMITEGLEPLQGRDELKREILITMF